MLYSSDVFSESEKRRKESNRVINRVVDLTDDRNDVVPDRRLMFRAPEPKAVPAAKREPSVPAVKRERSVKSEPTRGREGRVTVKRERSAERMRSRSRSRGTPAGYYAEDLCRKCITTEPLLQGRRREPRPIGTTRSAIRTDLERADLHGTDMWLYTIEHDDAFASHELCLRCGVEPADGITCPYRIAHSALRSVRSAVDTQVKTGAYDALNIASGAVLHRRGGEASGAATERMRGIRDQLTRALSQVSENIEGPTNYERRGNSSIYGNMPWETSAIGASDRVQRTPLEPPSARSHNGNSRSEQERRERAFGKGGKSKGHGKGGKSIGKGKYHGPTGANAIPLGKGRGRR